MMKKLGILIGSGLVAAGAAWAQPPGGHDPMRMLDADGNGEVSRAELTQHAAEMFRKLDADGDGRVTADEMRAHHQQMMAAHRRPPPPEGAGGPDGPPPAGMHGAGGPPRFERLDTDGDGAISLAEFTAGLEQHFAKADANGDGKVTRDEMEAAHRAMRPGR